MEVVYRLLVAGFVIVGPSALFILLVRGLDRLRDDQLVDDVLNRLDQQDGRGTTPAHVLTGGMVPAAPDEAFGQSDLEPCSACGAPNPAYATYCAACLGKLGGSDSPEAEA